MLSEGQNEGDLRLIDGKAENEGRLEVYHNFSWLSICDDYWDDKDATVACKQINYNKW